MAEIILYLQLEMTLNNLAVIAGNDIPLYPIHTYILKSQMSVYICISYGWWVIEKNFTLKVSFTFLSLNKWKFNVFFEQTYFMFHAWRTVLWKQFVRRYLAEVRYIIRFLYPSYDWLLTTNSKLDSFRLREILQVNLWKIIINLNFFRFLMGRYTFRPI